MVRWVPGPGLERRESDKAVLYLQLVIRGKKLQCGDLMPLYKGLERGGSSVEDGIEQPAIAPSDLHLGSFFGGDGVDGHHYW